MKLLRRHPIIAVLLLALLVRAVVLFALPIPDVYGTDTDSRRHEMAAQHILETGSYRYPISHDEPEYMPTEEFLRRPPNATVMPGYPSVIAAMWSLFGHDTARYVAIPVIQNLADVLSVWIVYLITLKFASRRASIWSALAVALYLPFAWISNVVMTESLATVSLLAAVLAFVVAMERKSASSLLLAGAAIGLATYIRPTPAAWPLFGWLAALPLWVSRTNWRDRWGATLRALLTYVIGAALVLLPWWIRNYLLHARFIPLTTWASMPPYEFSLYKLDRLLPGVLIDDPALNELEISALASRLHRELLASATPAEWARIILLRVWDGIWSVLKPYDLAGGYSGITSLQGWLLAPWYLIPHVALVVFSIAGFWRYRKDARALIVASVPLYFWITHTITFPTSRYMLPAMALLFVGAGPGIEWMVESMRRESAAMRSVNPEPSPSS